MNVTRNGDKVRIEIGAEEVLEWLDGQAVHEAILGTLSSDEWLRNYAIDPTRISGALVHLELDIEPPAGESDREGYLRENGVLMV